MSNFTFGKVTPETILKSISCKEDGFAKTFISKCNMMNALEEVTGLYVEEELASMILVTVSKRMPYCANLQLLHTFYKYRNMGYATTLVFKEFDEIYDIAEYFRVSSEPNAVGFYRKIGFKFWGKQKSGDYLSLFKIKGISISGGLYEKNEYVISQLFSGRRGSLVEEFDSGPI